MKHNNTNYPRFLICLLIFFCLKICNIQPIYSQIPDTFYFENPYEKRETLSFKFINNLIIIPLSINNSDTLRFILDTGVRTAIITELNTGKPLSLNYARRARIRGFGEGDDIEVLHSYGNEIRINNIIGTNQNIYVMLDHTFNISSQLGLPVHGIIGYDLFKSFVIEINYRRQELIFHNPEKYKYRRQRRKEERIPFIFHDKKPVIQAAVMINSKNTDVKLLIDSGSSDALWLFHGTGRQIKIPDNAIGLFLGKGLSGNVYGKKAPINDLFIGGYRFSSPICAFPDSSSVGWLTNNSERNGSLGAEIIRRFHVVFDYHKQLISLKPNSFFNDPFKHNMSGIEVMAPMPGLPFYEISQVQKNSPADRAGLKQGDQLIKINFQPAFDFDLPEINELFQSRHGKTIRITVLRDTVEYKAKFDLQNIFETKE